MSDSNYAFVAFLAKFDTPGAVPAADKKGNVLTAAGNAAVVADGGALTGAYLTLDGVSDYATTPGSAGIQLGAGNFCVDFGLKTTANNKCVLDYYDGTATGWQVFLTGSGYIAWWNGSTVKTGSIAVNNGARHHIAIFRYNGVIYIAVDGVLDGAGVANTVNHNTVSSFFAIGAQVTVRAPSYDLTGSLDFVRITVGTSRWSAAFTPPTLTDLAGSYLGAVTETLGLSMSVSGLRTMRGVVTEAIKLTSSANAVYLLGVKEFIRFTDTVSGRCIRRGAVAETLGLSSTAAAKALRLGHVSERIGLSATATAKGTYRGHITERIKFFEVTVRAGAYDADLAVWVASLPGAGHSRYAGFGFNSFAFFDGRYYGCKSDGIYELGGELDGAAPIPCTVTFAETDFRSDKLKRIPAVIAGGKFSGPLVLKVVQDPGNIYAYPLTPSGREGRAARAVPGKGLASRYWQFELASDTERIELESFDPQPAELSRRI